MQLQHRRLMDADRRESDYQVLHHLQAVQRLASDEG